MSAPFYICPLIHGVARIQTGRQRFFRQLKHTLDTLEPDGPSGEVRLGTTLPVNLLSLFRHDGDDWVYDEAPVARMLEFAAAIARPVVLQLTGNHFTGDGPLVKFLLSRTENLMQFGDGAVPADRYFRNNVNPFTLLCDPAIEVNRYRYQALRQVLGALQIFDREHPGLLVGVTLNGETHHLYGDFTDGGGLAGAVSITDYSAASVAGFRNWLRQRHGDLGSLNRLIGGDYRDWQSVRPPGDAAAAERSRLAYIDSHAHGVLTVEGWCDPLTQVREIVIEVDARPMARASLGLSRPDVFEHCDDIVEMNVGFRAELDYTGLKQGAHQLLARAICHDGRVFVVGRRQFHVVSAAGKAVAADWYRLPSRLVYRLAGHFRKESTGFRGWCDLPAEETRLLFNPLAQEWHQYRRYQVERYLEQFWHVAVSTGFDPRRLFSHQILIPYFGRRSEFLYATGDTLRPESVYQPGVTLYGGQTVSSSVAGLFSGRRYAVTEFHPLASRHSSIHAQALQLHRASGAVWVAPFFLSPFEPRHADPGYARFWIDPRNRQFGSNLLYEAIRNQCRE